MCNIQSPNTRALIIEVLENGKVSLPPVIHLPKHTLTIDELKKCRDYLDLIINNPDNFHIVSLEPLSIADSITIDIAPTVKEMIANGPYCRQCGDSLFCQTQTEQENKLCFKCEKEQILKASDSNRREVGNYAEKVITDQSPIIVNVKDDVAMPAITQIDDKICDWPGCGFILNKKRRPQSWAKGQCIGHDGKKEPKIKPIKTQSPTDIKRIL